LKDSQSRNVVQNATVALALSGEEERALTTINELAAKRPYDTIVQYVDVPGIKAIVALNHNQPGKAIDLLDGAMVYARADSAVLYGRGMAYLQARRGKEAADAFQRIIDLRAAHFIDPSAAIAHLGLARAYGLQGDTSRSRIEYQNFLALWKDADPDIPLLKQAKEEYARVL